LSWSFGQTDKFQAGGHKPSPHFISLRRRFARIRKSEIAFAVAAGPASWFCPPWSTPAFTKIFIDDFSRCRAKRRSRTPLAGRNGNRDRADDRSALLAANISCCGWKRNWLSRRPAKFFTHVIQLPMEFFSQRFAGEIGSPRVNQRQKLPRSLSEKLATTLLDMMSLVFFFWPHLTQVRRRA